MPNELQNRKIGFYVHFLHAGCASVVHCAAQKYPDKLEADFERSVALNVASTGWLAAATKEVGKSVIPLT
jgi:dTDP-4-dehydrorhamnose reductase